MGSCLSVLLFPSSQPIMGWEGVKELVLEQKGKKKKKKKRRIGGLERQEAYKIY